MATEKLQKTSFFQSLRAVRRKFFPRKIPKLSSFEYRGDKSISEDIKEKYAFSGELLDIFVDIRGPLINKWHHYIPIYDRHLSKFRNTKVRFLEIGVSKGGSLQMWRRYLGDDAIIYGIDIDPNCFQHDGDAGMVRIGSQIDTRFLLSVINEMGGVDVILDDGSHHMKHIHESLRFLFPNLNDCGLYIIEDLHTAFWPKWGGGYFKKENFFNILTQIIKDMHGWYHSNPKIYQNISDNCNAVHVYDSIVVLEKNKTFKPTYSQVT